MEDVYFSLGSNQGNCIENLKKAIELLTSEFKVVCVSSLYKTAPLDYVDQDMFYNCCIYCRTDLNPFQVLEKTKFIQKKMGQGKKDIRFGPRIIDIDIIFYSDMVLSEKELSIPHERMHKRAFVLNPLADINDNLVHPVLKKSIKELMNCKNVLEQEITKIKRW